MVKCGIRSEGNGLTVVVRNERTGYTFVGETYTPKSGPFGVSPVAFNEAKDAALRDAQDWAAKFQRAGLKAEVVEVLS